MKGIMLAGSLPLLAMLSLPALAHAAEHARPAAHAKVIDFDGDLVEGVNKRPLDSLSQISERERARRGRHLYRKRAGFRSETLKTIKDLRYQ